jgi:hypothetical protein
MKFLIFLFLLTLTISSNGQVIVREPINQVDVPVKIYQQFISSETEIKKVKWYKVGGLLYEVNFTKGNIQLINLYSVLDNSVKQKQLVDYKVLPDDIKERLKDDFLKGIKIKRIFKLLYNDKHRFQFYGTMGDDKIEFSL